MDKQTLSQNGTVTFSDVDNKVNITYSYNNDISWSGGTLNSTLSSALIAGFNTSATNVSSGSTSWSYNVNNVDLNFLAAGETITLSYNVIATDIAGATAMTTITFTITGTNDAPVFGTVTTGPTTITAPTAGTTNPNAGIETFNNGDNGSIDGTIKESWLCQTNLWGFSKNNDGVKIVGTEKQQFGFFETPRNETDHWHGYPIIPFKSKEKKHDICKSLLNKWKDGEVLTSDEIDRKSVV